MTSEARTPARRRFMALDGVRALAFIAVFGTHAGIAGLSGGGSGVSVFFTLSGFLITTILLGERRRSGGIAFLTFYFRRLVRLWPALLAMVLVFSAYSLVSFSHHLDFRRSTLWGALWSTFYAGNWHRAFGAEGALGLFGHTWSLAVEEQFYLLWPLVFVLAYKVRGTVGVLVASVIGSAISLGIRFSLSGSPNSGVRISNGTDTAADLLLIGCALACALLLRPDLVKRASTWLLLPALVVLGIRIGTRGSILENWTLGQTLLALSSAIIIGFLVTHENGNLARVLSIRPLAYLGLISYGLYLWHAPIVHIIEPHLHQPVLRVSTEFLLTLVIAALSYKVLEAPLLHWRDARTGRIGANDDARQVTADLFGPTGSTSNASRELPSA